MARADPLAAIRRSVNAKPRTRQTAKRPSRAVPLDPRAATATRTFEFLAWRDDDNVPRFRVTTFRPGGIKANTFKSGDCVYLMGMVSVARKGGWTKPAFGMIDMADWPAIIEIDAYAAAVEANR